jgi:hypothetical protein
MAGAGATGGWVGCGAVVGCGTAVGFGVGFGVGRMVGFGVGSAVGDEVSVGVAVTGLTCCAIVAEPQEARTMVKQARQSTRTIFALLAFLRERKNSPNLRYHMVILVILPEKKAILARSRS